MKKKVLCIIFVIICIIDIAITASKGLNVGLYYGEGYDITFSESNINLKEIKSIAKDVFGNKFVVQKVEFFNDSCMIKVKSVNDDQINNLCTKLNEKYSSELKSSDIKVEVRNIIEPYIIPTILSLLILLGYYAVRFRGASQMLGLVKSLIIADVLIYSIYAIGRLPVNVLRLPVNVLTMPISIIIYVLVVLGYTVYSEKQKESSK